MLFLLKLLTSKMFSKMFRLYKNKLFKIHFSQVKPLKQEFKTEGKTQIHTTNPTDTIGSLNQSAWKLPQTPNYIDKTQTHLKSHKHVAQSIQFAMPQRAQLLLH